MTCNCKHPYGFVSEEGLEQNSHLSEVKCGHVCWHVCKGFMANTTAHGITHAYHARGPIKITLWVVLFLVSLGLSAYTIAGLITRFRSWPVTVVVAVEHVKETDFPAVTMCNMNPVRLSTLANNSDLEALFEPRSTRKRRNVPNFSEETVLAFNLKKFLAEQDLETRKTLGHQLENFVLNVTYEGVLLEPDTFYTWFDPTHGNCFTFNSGWENASAVRTSHLIGPLYGLDVIFNIEQDEYMGDVSHSAGVRVVIHNRTTMPFPAEQGFVISPGEVTFIGLVELEIDRLRGHYGNCTEVTGEQNLTRNVYEEYYPVLYTADGCLHTCFQKNVIELCGCAMSDIPTRGQAFGDVNVPICDIMQIHVYDCYYDVKQKYIHSELNCACEISCHEAEYIVTTSSGVWPSENYKEDLLISILNDHPDLQELLYHPNDNTKYKRHLGKVSVYFNNFNREVIREVAAYSVTALLSDIGGALGLFVGFSILTVTEFIEIFVDFLVLASCRCCCRKKVKDNHSINNQDPDANPHSEQHNLDPLYLDDNLNLDHYPDQDLNLIQV